MPCQGNSRSYRPQPSVFKGVQGCRLPAPKCFRRPCQGNSRSYRPQPSVFKGVQGCRLPAPKCFRRPCQGNSRSYRPQPSVFKGVQGCRFVAFGSASFVCPPSCSLLLPLFEMVLQGTVCTQTNHACLGPALTQYKLSMGRLLPQCACP